MTMVKVGSSEDTNCHHWMMTIDDNCQGTFIRGHGRTDPATILVPMSPVLLLFQPMSPLLLICNYFSPATALTT